MNLLIDMKASSRLCLSPRPFQYAAEKRDAGFEPEILEILQVLVFKDSDPSGIYIYI